MKNAYDHISDEEKTLVKMFFLKNPNFMHLKDLQSFTGIKERKITAIIQELRKEGIPILSHRIRGFWLSEDEVEIKNWIKEWENETKRRFLVIKELKRKFVKEPKTLFQKLFNT